MREREEKKERQVWQREKKKCRPNKKQDAKIMITSVCIHLLLQTGHGDAGRVESCRGRQERGRCVCVEGGENEHPPS